MNKKKWNKIMLQIEFVLCILFFIELLLASFLIINYRLSGFKALFCYSVSLYFFLHYYNSFEK